MGGILVYLRVEPLWAAWLMVIAAASSSLFWGWVSIPGRRAGAGRVEPFAAVVREDRIEISGYPYRHSTLYGRPAAIAPARVSCVFNSISDTAFVLDGREVIFLPADQKDAFGEFVRRHRIPDHRLDEVWRLIADPYLDQLYSDSDEARDDKWLAELGVRPDETRRLRGEIADVMLARTARTWEWGLYTTRDVLDTFATLAPKRLTSDFYWRVMEVALRPYPASTRGGTGDAPPIAAGPAGG